MDYSATIQTRAPAQKAARSIFDDLDQWWSSRVEHTPQGFTIRFNNSHASFAIEPGGSDLASVWACTDAHMIMDGVDDLREWVGTQLIWTVTPAPGGSTVTLTHKGLTPQIACYDICQRGWQHFFQTSLRDHLNGDTAAPNTD